MQKISTEATRHALHGPTMGTRWSALFHTTAGFDPRPVQRALQAVVDEVDAQMSTWKPDSDLMRLNKAKADDWVPLPEELMSVLVAALDVGRGSHGAFDIGVGGLVEA